ncbi:hydroxyacylglutathione hydrolase [Sphingobium agri]|uniref:Hydroxyacylglutathione hydrolase n=1 Tax=Sphingobium agri TaxID=2933566 RepID=A0ABT0DYP8_9SPHN|nr:hydroxyacylglutathione hydrolase [Sphingobium agri]MCK0532241.1 hydroxyacylglutathione hydrolase [Sphingobium agri]
MLSVARVAVLSDNYVWLLHDDASGETVVIDPAVAEPVLAAAAERGWAISQIWNTHWHGDHVGGNAAIKAATGCRITGPAAEAAKIGALDRQVGEGDEVRIGGHVATVMEVPAHTAGHIAYHLASDRIIFVGDTLFAMGCGRLFEGTADQMFANMARFAALPDETAVYCAHEYTQGNGRFALTIEPDNEALVARMAEVDEARARGEATVPTTIGLERATNIFMRANDVQELARRRTAKDTA